MESSSLTIYAFPNIYFFFIKPDIILAVAGLDKPIRAANSC